MSDVIRDGDMVLTPGEFGRVVGGASGPVVVVDHDGHYAVYQRDEVEAVVGVSERDAAIAERDRLRRELEVLREQLAQGRESNARVTLAICARDCHGRLDAILRGEP